MGKIRTKDNAAHTFYFETYCDKKKLFPLLQTYMQDNGLTYYKYVTNDVVDKVKLVKWAKTCGVLQYNKRRGKTIISQLFADDGVYMNVMKPSEVPTLLCQLKLYVLAEHHSVPHDEYVCSKTPFGFKGRRTTNEAKFFYPYMKALQLYDNYKQPSFYPHLPCAKRICEFKYMLKNSTITI
jgi:hypothetical protein